MSSTCNRPQTIEFPNKTCIEVDVDCYNKDSALNLFWKALDIGADCYHAAVASLGVVTGCKWVYATNTDTSTNSAQVMAMWQTCQFSQCIEYQLAGTPCYLVTRSENQILIRDVVREYPEDLYLKELGVKDYLGQSIKKMNGDIIGHEIIGHIGIMHDSSFDNLEIIEGALGVIIKALELELN